MTATVFFDLDGTLTDPKPGITRSIQHAMRELGLDEPSEDDLIWCIGPPLPASLEKLVGPQRSSRALELFRERFSDIGLYENELYPGVREMLDGLLAEGRRLFVASSKPQVFVRRIVEHFDIGTAFSDVFGSELDGTRMDKTELLSYAVSRTKSVPGRCVMVGDREHDGIGAANNAMPFIGVGYGYGSEEELIGSQALCVVRSPRELAQAIAATG